MMKIIIYIVDCYHSDWKKYSNSQTIESIMELKKKDKLEKLLESNNIKKFINNLYINYSDFEKVDTKFALVNHYIKGLDNNDE